MNAIGLIEILLKLPPEAVVMFVYDGAARGNCDKCYLSKNGSILIVDHCDESIRPEEQPI